MHLSALLGLAIAVFSTFCTAMNADTPSRIEKRDDPERIAFPKVNNVPRHTNVFGVPRDGSDCPERWLTAFHLLRMARMPTRSRPQKRPSKTSQGSVISILTLTSTTNFFIGYSRHQVCLYLTFQRRSLIADIPQIQKWTRSKLTPGSPVSYSTRKRPTRRPILSLHLLLDKSEMSHTSSKEMSSIQLQEPIQICASSVNHQRCQSSVIFTIMSMRRKEAKEYSFTMSRLEQLSNPHARKKYVSLVPFFHV